MKTTISKWGNSLGIRIPNIATKHWSLKNGDILFAYSRYGGDGCEDGSSADIYASISTDNGESFGEPFELIPRHLLNADTLMSVSFFENGKR